MFAFNQSVIYDLALSHNSTHVILGKYASNLADSKLDLTKKEMKFSNLQETII